MGACKSKHHQLLVWTYQHTWGSTKRKNKHLQRLVSKCQHMRAYVDFWPCMSLCFILSCSLNWSSTLMEMFTCPSSFSFLDFLSLSYMAISPRPSTACELFIRTASHGACRYSTCAMLSVSCWRCMGTALTLPTLCKQWCTVLQQRAHGSEEMGPHSMALDGQSQH